MGARQHANANADRAHGTRVTTVDARFTIKNLATNNLRFEREQNVAHQVGIRCLLGTLGQLFHQVLANLRQAGAAGLLLTNAVGLIQIGIHQLGDARDQRFVLWCCFPVPGRLGRFIGQ